MPKWTDCHLDAEQCLCRGEGWTLCGSSFEECPVHYEGQLHPDSKSLLFDDPKALEAAQYKSKLTWLIKEKEIEISYLEKKLAKAKETKLSLEKEFNTKRTTTRMPAVKLHDTN